MNKSSKYKINENIHSAFLDNEICLFNNETNEYLNLNSTATIIWEFFSSPQSLQDINNKLLEKFNSDRESIINESKEFIEQLISLNIIEKV